MAADYRTWGLSWGESWEDSWGIGLAAEEGIGLAPVAKPVDYIFHDGWHPSIPRMSNVTRLEERKAVRTDNSELTEMMDLYSRWRRAA